MSYLCFEDKVRLECVSKQWRRYVYQKQFGLKIVGLDSKQTKHSLRQLTRRNSDQSNDRIDGKALESILKKCRFITTISSSFDFNSDVLALIGRYCHYIKSLRYRRNGVKSVNDHTLWSLIGHYCHYLWSFFYRSESELSFYRIYGHKLTELYINQRNIVEEDNEEIKHYLEFCPNLTKVYVSKLSLILNENKEFVPKLKHIINKWSYVIGSEDVNNMKILSNKYSQTLNTLSVYFGGVTEEELKTCVDSICRLEKLKRLKIYFNSWYNTEHIENSLSLIGQKCTKLLKLELINMIIPNNLFDAFSHFKDITRLCLMLSTDSIAKASVESLKNCKQLMYLEINYRHLDEDYFTNVKSFLPKLKRLKINSDKQFSETFIDSFHSMKNIEKVFLSVRNVPNYTFDQKYWYFGKCLSEVMSSPKGKDVIRVTDNCGLYRCDANTKSWFTEEV